MRKFVKRLLVVTLFTIVLALTMESAPVKANPIEWIVPSANSPTLAIAVALAGPNDHIHVLNGYQETLTANLFITQTNLWIIGAPPQLGPMPTIDLNGFSIFVLGSGVFIWGLNIKDSGGSPIGILLSSSNCMIMNNTITGLNASIGIGIQVMNSSMQFVAQNTISAWNTCIQLAGPPSINNAIVGNTLNPPYVVGIEVTGGAGFNKIYWNNLMAPIELLDTNPPGSPPNWFDDTTGGGLPGLHKGNYEITWHIIAPPFTVPGPNGYMDNWPLAAPWTHLTGDINVDGRVNLADLVMIASSWVFGNVWCVYSWDPRCDLAAPWGNIGLTDFVTLAIHYGSVDP